MCHCVASYWRHVESGNRAVYRVLEPERATLALRWNRARALWSIEQIKGHANEPVRRETRRFLRDWVETGQVDPAAVRWAREQARRRCRAILSLLVDTTDPGECAQLRAEVSRLRVGEPRGG